MIIDPKPQTLLIMDLKPSSFSAAGKVIGEITTSKPTSPIKPKSAVSDPRPAYKRTCSFQSNALTLEQQQNGAARVTPAVIQNNSCIS